jgi:hypothetical protein
MKHYIYKTFRENGQYYIGRHSTNNLNDGYQGSGKWVKDCISSGIKLQTEILEFCDTVEVLKEKEHEYLKEHHNKEHNMNFLIGSDGWCSHDVSGEKNFFYKNPRIGELNGMYGKKHKPETIEKMKQNRKGKNIGHTRNNGVNNPNYGKTMSEETKNKISESLKGRKMTPEHIAKTRRNVI